MDKKDYDNPLRRQCMSIPELCNVQLDRALKGMLEGVPQNVLSRMRNVIMTGSGDSYFAACAALPALKKYNSEFGAVLKCERCIDLARSIKLPVKNAADTLIVGISASGSSARIREVFLRANHAEYETLLITNNPESLAGKVAKNNLFLNIPEYPESSPGLRNYFAALIGSYLLAVHLGKQKGFCAQDSVQDLIEKIKAYILEVAELLDEIDDAMFNLAVQWKKSNCFDLVGDDICFSTGQFIAAKFVESAGIICPTSNSEDWCHVNYFGSEPENKPVIVIANVKANNRSRIGEMVNQAASVGRPVLLISNGKAVEFEIDHKVNECYMPTPPSEFDFLLALVYFLPGAILASYISSLLKEKYFRGNLIAKEGKKAIVESEILIV